MSEPLTSALLPNGLKDLLPPDARHESTVLRLIMAALAGHGYGRVDPPLVEYEDTLFAGPGGRVAGQTFRLMDPVTQRMMGVRADMTPQVARIATTRLKSAPRPLRLSYGGQVLRVRGGQLRPERQFTQAGAELVGPDSPLADAEIMALAAEALARVGATEISIDIALPTLAPELLDALNAPADARATIEAALETRDDAALEGLSWAGAALFPRLLQASGPVESALPALAALDLPEPAAGTVRRAAQVVARLGVLAPGLILTLDPVERRGFEYQTGVAFTVFARGVRGELGRGGRYRAVPGDEPAVGFSLFLDSVMRALPGPAPVRRILMPLEAPQTAFAALRAEGWATVACLEKTDDPAREAGRLACGYYWTADGPVAVG
jgi:ATP phosphoribosyltransferase regulatory subunit